MSRDGAARLAHHVLVSAGAVPAIPAVQSRPRRAAWPLLVPASAVLGSALWLVARELPGAPEDPYRLAIAVGGMAYGLTGAWLVAVRPALPTGRILLFVGGCLSLSHLALAYGVLALLGDASLPLGGPALWVGTWLWAPGYLVVAAVLPMLLPDGRVPPGRWRAGLSLGVTAVAFSSVGWALLPLDQQDVNLAVGGAANPVGTDVAAHPLVIAAEVALLLLAVLVALASIILRWRRSREDERAQLSWVLYGGAVTLTLLVVAFLLPHGAAGVVGAVGMVPLPAALLVAALRHRLFDIDRLVSRSLALVVLTAGVLGTYVGAVGLLGGALGGATGVPVLVTAAVAVAAAPVRRRVQRAANRLVYGDIDDPYQRLARSARRLGETLDPEQVAARVLPELLDHLRDVLHARYAAVRVPSGELSAAGERSGPHVELPLVVGGTEVGHLVVGGRSDGLTRTERRLLERVGREMAVAVQAALLTRESREAREQAVSAAEEERRHLRRELHDGVGPALASAALQVETARDVLAEDPAAAAAILDRTVGRLQDAVREVRSVVSGLRPGSLDELGLAGAVRELAAQFEDGGVQVAVDAPELGRLPAAVDAAAYRISAEAIANAVRHGRPGRVDVRLRRHSGALRLEVVDDGVGLPDLVSPGVGLASMRRRAQDVGGTLTVDRGPEGRGTSVRAVLPLGAP